jgi:hypothetical protein
LIINKLRRKNAEKSHFFTPENDPNLSENRGKSRRIFVTSNAKEKNAKAGKRKMKAFQFAIFFECFLKKVKSGFKNGFSPFHFHFDLNY